MPFKEIRYIFNLTDGRIREYRVEIDSDTGRLKPPAKDMKTGAWTFLQHQKCSHCPLSADQHFYCPVARNLANVTQDFKNDVSFNKVDVEVHTSGRIYRKNISMQDALFGLIGLIMTASDCPYVEFLRPTAIFHIPFSTTVETLTQSVSFYLLQQYFIQKKGGAPDFSLHHLKKMYADLEKVNVGMLNRIRGITNKDADANSILILNSLAQLLAKQISAGLDELEPIFGVAQRAGSPAN